MNSDLLPIALLSSVCELSECRRELMGETVRGDRLLRDIEQTVGWLSIGGVLVAP
jgi:hypothetical protein